MLIKNKRGMNIAIFALVLLTIILITVVFVHFSFREKKIRNELDDALYLEEFYSGEDYINFYVQYLLDTTGVNIVAGTSMTDAKQRVAYQLKDNLDVLKWQEEYVAKKEDDFVVKERERYLFSELNKLKHQLTDPETINNIKIDNVAQTYSIPLSFHLSYDFVKKGKEFLSVSYAYNKTFIGDFEIIN
ncbi:hypothetical protein GOV14_00340 [Candidatus Pacearchaeota archaeon]|nr:hypothetical protein [Candidatus Pacearchaeota archaeon]